ncbi:MAG TPA: NADH-quinone oxidoreductase subunit M [Acidobacteriaceae bacterium]|jgi:NADH-quinone oxidoreductase subunit M|nr:NADH-quinone oxidoreductase subunit M [Acidobacteriaceae bacterium]
MITLLTLLPILGGLLVLVLGRSRPLARLIAMMFAMTGLVLALLFWYALDPNLPGMQFTQYRAWAPTLGIAYHVGADGLGVLLLVLSALLVVFSLMASWGNERLGRVYFALVLFLEAGLFGTFTALNFVHWFLYWELSLIPAYFLVRLWGGPARARAANQFFLYTMVGSVALLLAFLAIFLATNTFDFVELTRQAHSGQLTVELANNLPWFRGATIAPWLFWAAFLGFAVKTPVVPFHTWLPATYAEAPSETTMLLTGAMSKMGVYGFLRILLPIFPQEMQHFMKPLLWLAVATIVLPAFAAWVQKDLKRTFAYSSINHLGYCVLGVCVAAQLSGVSPHMAAERAAALTGVLLQIFSHGLTAATLFWFIALLERRTGGLRGVEDFGGLRRVVPVFCGLMGIAIFASLGLPGLNGFPGEFLIFKGAFPLATVASSVAVLGLLLTAIFLLTVIQKVFSGRVNPRWEAMPDLTTTERVALFPAIALMFVLGFYPQLITGMVHGTVMQWIAGGGL